MMNRGTTSDGRARRFLWVLQATVLALLASTPVQAELYGQDYELQTLDHRFAAALVVDLCKEHGKNLNNCKVQAMEAGRLVVFAPSSIHAELVLLLGEKDPPRPTSLGFRVVLVQPGDPGQNEPHPSADVRRALDAVRELLGTTTRDGRQPTIQDSALVRTADGGSSRLVGKGGTAYELGLALRSAVTRKEGLELTVELDVGTTTGDPERLLSSVVTLRVGETVVAGTSRTPLDNEPLIVLLSSLPDA